MSTAQAIAERDEVPTDLEPARDQMVAMIERIALDPAIPIERLERVLAMKERMEDRAREDDDRRAKREYFAAMSKCQAALPVVTKNRRNVHTKSNYADLAAIEQQAMPIIHQHGFAVSFQPDGYNDKGEQRVLWQISHEGGYSREGVGEIPVDKAGSQGTVNKTGTQAFGSTATYGRRYLLCLLFNISTGDDNDGNAFETPDLVNIEQLEEIDKLIDEAVKARPGTTREAWVDEFLTYMKVASLADIPAKDFGKAKTAILGAIKQGAGK